MTSVAVAVSSSMARSRAAIGVRDVDLHAPPAGYLAMPATIDHPRTRRRPPSPILRLLASAALLAGAACQTDRLPLALTTAAPAAAATPAELTSKELKEMTAAIQGTKLVIISACHSESLIDGADEFVLQYNKGRTPGGRSGSAGRRSAATSGRVRAVR